MISYQLLALKTADRFRYSSMTTCAIYNNLAFTYNSLNQDKDAAVCLKKAIIIANRN